MRDLKLLFFDELLNDARESVDESQTGCCAEVKWQRGCVGSCSSDEVGGRTRLQVMSSLADNQCIVSKSVLVNDWGPVESRGGCEMEREGCGKQCVLYLSVLQTEGWS
jgi:hypothetical protein